MRETIRIILVIVAVVVAGIDVFGMAFHSLNQNEYLILLFVVIIAFILSFFFQPRKRQQ
jgi:hypothetical protein